MRDRKRDTRGNGYREKGIRCRGIEDFRESSLRHSRCTAISEFHVGRHQISQSGNKLFGSIVNAARSSPLFLPMESSFQPPLISPRRSWNDPPVSTILLITSGFFNWIWSSAIPLSHPLDRKPTICTDLCRFYPSPSPLSVYRYISLENS